MRKVNIAIAVIVILSFVIAFYAFNTIEEDKVASHWNAAGDVDNYMSKFWGLFLFPLILVGVYLLFLVIPMIDPLKNNIKKFMKYYELLMLFIILLLFYIFILTVAANLGYNFNMTVMIFPAIGLLFIGIGIIMKELKRNWFVGIRTPWTLSSDVVWKKTHKLAGTLFRVVGVLMFVGLLLPPEYLVWFILIPVAVMVVWLFVYSYLEYKKIKK